LAANDGKMNTHGRKMKHRLQHRTKYKLGECLLISVEIIKLWWRFLGHILRLLNGVPAKPAMQLFYTERFRGSVAHRRKHRGHAFTTLPSLLAEEFGLLKGRRFELTGGALRGIGELTT